jgi:hypothetical protein
VEEATRGRRMVTDSRKMIREFIVASVTGYGGSDMPAKNKVASKQ